VLTQVGGVPDRPLVTVNLPDLPSNRARNGHAVRLSATAAGKLLIRSLVPSVWRTCTLPNGDRAAGAANFAGEQFLNLAYRVF